MEYVILYISGYKTKIILIGENMRYLAAIFMLIDHIGMVLYPENMMFRIIGRLAMPIFAYGIAMGFIHTSSLKKYIIRLGIFTAVSQPFFLLMKYSINARVTGVNIGATFLIACVALILIDTKINYVKLNIENKWINMINNIIRGGLLILLCILTQIIKCDYGIYGVMVVIAFYYGIRTNSDEKGYMCFIIITLLNGNLIQMFSILSIVLLPYAKNRSKRTPKYFFYVFYPLHMLVIYLVKIIVY